MQINHNNHNQNLHNQIKIKSSITYNKSTKEDAPITCIRLGLDHHYALATCVFVLRKHQKKAPTTPQQANTWVSSNPAMSPFH
jgi:hypothetical protein